MEQETGKHGGDNISSADTLANEITELATRGDFRRAERMRAYLLEHYPLALSAIIATAEIIEEQKALRIDHDHLAIWDELYSRLSREEKNCLFYATKSATIDTGKLLIRQGKPLSRLLFIDSGRVTLFHSRGDERILLGQLSRGDILGEETFCNFSSPTFSAGAQTEVHLRYLNKPETQAWEESHPGLVQKLADYCMQNSRANSLLGQKKIEKRMFKRVRADCRVVTYILREDGGRSGESFRGSLLDFSQLGASLDIHCSRAATAHALLGKKMDLEFEPGEGVSSKLAALRGDIVKIGMMMHNDYSVHVRLASKLYSQEFEKYLRICTPVRE